MRHEFKTCSVRYTWHCEELHYPNSLSNTVLIAETWHARKRLVLLLSSRIVETSPRERPAALPLMQSAVVPRCGMKCWHHPSFFHSPCKRGSTVHRQKRNSGFYSQLPLETHFLGAHGDHQGLFSAVHLRQTQTQLEYRHWLEHLNASAMPCVSSCFVMLYGQEIRFRLWQQDRQSNLYRNTVVRHH